MLFYILFLCFSFVLLRCRCLKCYPVVVAQAAICMLRSTLLAKIPLVLDVALVSLVRLLSTLLLFLYFVEVLPVVAFKLCFMEVPQVQVMALTGLVMLLSTLLLYLCFVEVPPVLEVALAALVTLLCTLLHLCFV
jgi:hypothetical protein